jgi:hypothetical protein
MKNQIITIATIFFSVSLTLSQINLEKKIENEELQVYTNSSETYYYSTGYDLTKVKIYNSDFSLKTEFTPQFPNGRTNFSISPYEENFSLSKKIFNDDDLLEIVINFSGKESFMGGTRIIKIYNENGELVKDFGDNVDYRYWENGFNIYHDNSSNENKLILFNMTTNSTEIYRLSTSSLATNEIIQNKSIKSYPNPVKEILYIENLIGNENNIIIYDSNSKEVFKQKIPEKLRNTAINVKSLKSGVYYYRIGNLTNKFIKE